MDRPFPKCLMCPLDARHLPKLLQQTPPLQTRILFPLRKGSVLPSLSHVTDERNTQGAKATEPLRTQQVGVNRSKIILTLRAWRAKRGRVVPGRQRGELHPPKRPRKLGVEARAVPHGCRPVIRESSVSPAPQRGRSDAPMTGTAGACYLVGSARPIAQGRAKRPAEHADSPDLSATSPRTTGPTRFGKHWGTSNNH